MNLKPHTDGPKEASAGLCVCHSGQWKVAVWLASVVCACWKPVALLLVSALSQWQRVFWGGEISVLTLDSELTGVGSFAKSSGLNEKKTCVNPALDSITGQE